MPNGMLGKDSGVTIGLMIVVLGAAVSLAWWFGSWIGTDRAWKEATDRRLEAIESAVQTGTKDRWTASDMKRWATRLEETNEDVDVPEPYHHDG